jgi:hypothetical protein
MPWHDNSRNLTSQELITRPPGSEERNYTYTIITTSSNKQLNFLHDRMPVILENGSEEIRTWLDPKRSTWSKDLQTLLKPFLGELEIYPVSKEVGKVGNNSPNFIIPVASTENKSNIANFFAKGASKGDSKSTMSAKSTEEHVPKAEDTKPEPSATHVKHEEGEDRKTVDHDGPEDNAPLPVPKADPQQGVKRELEDVPDADEQPKKIARSFASPAKASSPSKKPAGRSKNPTSNNTASPSKSVSKGRGSQKITNFFGK